MVSLFLQSKNAGISYKVTHISALDGCIRVVYIPKKVGIASIFKSKLRKTFQETQWVQVYETKPSSQFKVEKMNIAEFHAWMQGAVDEYEDQNTRINNNNSNGIDLTQILPPKSKFNPLRKRARPSLQYI